MGDRTLADGWDSKKSRGCKCDPYYTGNDCSVRMCPKGNDPLTKTVQLVGQSKNYYASIKELGVAEVEKPEIQTVVLSPTRPAATNFDFDGIGGHFTLAYTDMYGQTWTTRPIRVKTKVVTGTDRGTVANSGAYSLISSTIAEFGLFEDHDNVRVQYGAIDKIVKVREHGAGMQALLVEPQLTTQSSDTAITLTLVNQDSGEIGVTRALTELPNQVIPSITVDETITTRVNVFRITFSDVANAGDQAPLSCRVDACDTDGCQPRKGAMVAQQSDSSQSVLYEFETFKITTPITGLNAGDSFAYASSNHGTSPPTPPGTVESIGSGFFILKERNFGSADMGSAANVDVKFLNKLNDRDKRAALKKTFVCAASGSCVVDSSKFACTGGGNGCGFSKNDIVLLTSQPGPAQSESPNDGLHRVVLATEDAKVTLEGIGKSVTAVTSGNGDSSGNIVLTRVNTFPCSVMETRKGTSENLECSGRGACDGSSGECQYFEGYTSDDCSVQTVL